jgi:hypothetical protein
MKTVAADGIRRTQTRDPASSPTPPETIALAAPYPAAGTKKIGSTPRKP